MRVGKVVGKWRRGLGIGGVFLGDLVDFFFCCCGWLMSPENAAWLHVYKFILHFQKKKLVGPGNSASENVIFFGMGSWSENVIF